MPDEVPAAEDYLRVAVIGSGPSGVYAAEALGKRPGVSVDVYDRLPCPYGLLRYGVAPDHLKIKSISAALHKVFERPGIRFLGNVDVGVQIGVEELRRYYDAVVYAFGSAKDRRMGIPGEDLPGSISATEFVAWYSGHPDVPADVLPLDAPSVAVVGAGNVAVDVARILAKRPDALATTDIPDHVVASLEHSKVEDVYMLVRRGPLQAKFTTVELRELGELADTDVVVDPAELDPAVIGPEGAAEPVARRNLEVLRQWSQRPLTGARRRIHVRFFVSPVEVVGDDRATAIRLERTRLTEGGSAAGTGEFVELPCQLVLRSVGYHGVAMPGVPFDAKAGVIPNIAGRVLRDGEPATGEYVVGWIKRGPTGVIGTNKHDARETVESLLADAEGLPRAPERDPGAVLDELAERGVTVVPWTGWVAIDSAECALGAESGRARVKIVPRDRLVQIAGGDPSGGAVTAQVGTA